MWTKKTRPSVNSPNNECTVASTAAHYVVVYRQV